MTTILLLAGLSTRMGRNKLLLPYKGKALFEHPLAIAARHSDNVVCVLGYEKEKVKRILSSYDVTMKYNPDFEKGQRSSTMAGLEGICDDVAILPGDLPLLTGSYGTVFDTDIPELYQALLDDKLTGGH